MLLEELPHGVVGRNIPRGLAQELQSGLPPGHTGYPGRFVCRDTAIVFSRPACSPCSFKDHGHSPPVLSQGVRSCPGERVPTGIVTATHCLRRLVITDRRGLQSTSDLDEKVPESTGDWEARWMVRRFCPGFRKEILRHENMD